MGRQQRIPGTEGRRIKELDAAAEAYQAAKTERVSLSNRETETRNAVLALMQQHKLTTYRSEEADLLFELSVGEPKVKVRKLRDESGADDDDEAE